MLPSFILCKIRNMNTITLLNKCELHECYSKVS